MEVQGLFCFQIILFGILTVFKSCDGFCFVGNLMAEMTVSRRLRYYCELNSLDGPSLRLFPGSNLYLVDQCLECKCTMDGLECCGFGHAGAAIAIRKDCRMILDGCQPLLVKTDNQSLDCFTGKPINITYLSELTPHPDNMYMYTSGNFAKPMQSQSSIETSSTPTTETASKSPITVTAQTSNAQTTSSLSTTAPTTSFPSTPAQTTSSLSTPAPTTPAPSTTAPTTIAELPEATIKTTTTPTTPRPDVQSNFMAPSFAEYLRHLITAMNSPPNLVSEPHFAPFWNTGSNAQFWNTGINEHVTSFPPAQHPQRSSNTWQSDYVMPWFLFL